MIKSPTAATGDQALDLLLLMNRRYRPETVAPAQDFNACGPDLPMEAAE
jgi:hypothetical protein